VVHDAWSAEECETRVRHPAHRAGIRHLLHDHLLNEGRVVDDVLDAMDVEPALNAHQTALGADPPMEDDVEAA